MDKNELKFIKKGQKVTKSVFFDFSGWLNFIHLVQSDLTVFKGLRLLKRLPDGGGCGSYISKYYI